MANLIPDDHNDMLMELVTHPGWRVLKARVRQALDNKLHNILEPSTDLTMVVRKEAYAEGYRSLERFFTGLEDEIDRYAKHVKRGA